MISSHYDRLDRSTHRAMKTNSQPMRMNSHATPNERVDYSAETHSLKEVSTLGSHSAVLAAESNAAHCVPPASAPEAVVCSFPDCVRPAAAASRWAGAIPTECCFHPGDGRCGRGQGGFQVNHWTWFPVGFLRCLRGTLAIRHDLPAS